MADVSFGEWLKRQRGAKGWTQTQLAQQISCSISMLRKMESEERRPSVQVIEQLIEIFNVPQSERKSFQQFARGDWGAFSGNETENAAWHKLQVTQQTNLPASMTSFIGREKEQVEIANLLTKYRLVTLAGVGGIGKTRLVLQMGQKLLDDYPDGVWFIPLDSLSDPVLIPQTVAAVFEIREGTERPVIEIMTNFLRQKTALLILDNCEHLQEACAQFVTTLLTNCPNLKVLATSRETLNIAGEAIYSMPALILPEQDVPLEELKAYASVRLFAERAALAALSFTLTSANAPTVVDICQRVDGIPLAIELAAAQVHILSVEEILKQLQDSFSLLANDGRTALARHQTLRASMDWSWGLLSQAEQISLQQLSVFAGGWTLESAQAVCDGDILNLTSALVKKSLIVVDQRSGRETRYRFHEIVLQYAHEKMTQSGETEKIRTRHLKYFLRLSEQAGAALTGPSQIELMAKLNDELDNIRTALGWADHVDTEAGLYMSSRLSDFWENLDVREGSRWLERFVQKPESKSYPYGRAIALLALGWLTNWLERLDDARSFAQEGLELFRACGDKHGEVDALMLVAVLVNPSEASEYHQQALTLAQSLNDTWRIAHVLSTSSLGSKDRVSSVEEALNLFQQVGDLRHMAECMAELGRLKMLNNEFELAIKIFDEASSLARKLSIKSIMSNILQGYGQIATKKGDFEQAHISLKAAMELDEEYGGRLSYLFSRSHLGYLALYQGDITSARQIFAETSQEFFNDKNEIGVIFNLEGTAGVFVAIGQLEIAVKLIGLSDYIRRKIGDTRSPFEQADVDKIIAACLEKMGEAAFADAYEAGKKMTLDEAVAYALEES